MAEPVVTTSMFTEPEQSAWEVAVERGLPIGAADLRALLNAAMPFLVAAEVSAHRAEQDAIHADLSQLLRVLGFGDHARPQSSHEVMLEAINEVGRLRRFADAIRAEERERVAAELQQEAATHLFTIRRTMRWAVWVVRGRPDDDDPAGDYLVRPGAADERPVCCPVETEAVARALAAERERAEALIVQAQDYASAESDRAGKLAALALKILNQCVALHPTGEAGYLDEWSMALEQLDGAAGEMSPPDSDPLEEANQAGIRWERERIISLASTMRAAFPADHPKGAQASFADYLRVTSADRPREDGNA